MNKIRVRFAPSPTGFLHVGGLRSALYNYLFAKQNGGEFILRIEDTDQKRFVENAVESLIDSLEWSEILWDEGVFKSAKIKNDNIQVISSKKYPGIIEVGDNGPYIQSERLALYKQYADQLVKAGKAYYCFCDPERLEEMREGQIAKRQSPMYDRYCLRNVNEEEVNKKLKENLPFTIRLKVPDQEIIEFDDIIRGKVSINSNTIDNQVLLKSDGFPTYHLANVVDDHEMKITHVIRGEEWLPSTSKHILLYQAFGWEVPEFAHLPLLLSTDKKKLSKRMGDVAVEDYVKNGYLKGAIINFVALLGWNPGAGETQEIFSMDELVEKFDLKKVHKAGAVFDLKKLDWLNAQYIKKLSIDNLYELVLPFLEEKEFYNDPSPLAPLPMGEEEKKEYLKKVLMIEQERLNNLSEAGENNKFFFQEIRYDKGLLRWKDMLDSDIISSLKKSEKILSQIDAGNWTKENLEKTLLEAAGDKRGDLLWPLRAALTGEKKSPPPFEVAWVLGKEECLKRIKEAIKKI